MQIDKDVLAIVNEEVIDLDDDRLISFTTADGKLHKFRFEFYIKDGKYFGQISEVGTFVRVGPCNSQDDCLKELYQSALKEYIKIFDWKVTSIDK